MQDWDFGSLPKSWIDLVRREIAEVWVPSRFVRNAFVNAGVEPDKVHIVPYGYSQDIIGDRTKPYPLSTSKRFKFLFVGSAAPREGLDLLLAAFEQCFDASDDVCLVVKCSRHPERLDTVEDDSIDADRRIEEFQERPGNPELLMLKDDLAERELASLYAACDCLVYPFRGEAFGLPAFEAMANGLPVIATGFGPILDYCNDGTAYLLPAKAQFLTTRKIGEFETADRPFLAQPDFDRLRAVMKHVSSSPPDAIAKGAAARLFVCAHYTWERAVNAIEARLLAIAPLRRNEDAFEGTLKPGSVSLCMIVKNEEQNLEACLNSVRDLVDELVVVDTGSSDRTREIASACGARVFEFPWIDDFAAARNESLRHARGDWIFWMDADDRLDEAGRAKLKETLANLEDDKFGYVMKCRCLPDQDSGTITVVDHVRLFRRHPDVRWKYRIHEQILPSIRKLGKEIAWADVVIDHTGYQDPTVRRRKMQRDVRLLELEDRENPNDPFTLFNIGSVRQEMGETQEALIAFRRSLAGSSPSDSIVRKLYALIAQCERQLDRLHASLEACTQGRSHYPDDVELLFQEGITRRALGDLRGAEACYVAAMAPSADKHFASIDVGIRTYKARHNLAVLCKEQSRFADAETHWRAAVDESPSFLPAWLGLTSLLIQGDRLEEALAAANAMESIPGFFPEGQLVRASVFMRKQQYGKAIAMLEKLISDDPHSLPPRIILTHALLQEGTNLKAAEQALLQVLRMDPNNAEAQWNLKKLRADSLETL
ncbi:MAG: glycosyltransferase [Gemmataceae bacterium]|nr:glycosyltransferase [Gemmataceae bacterium]